MDTKHKLTRQEWLEKCAARLIEEAKIDEGLARDIAESQLKNLNDDLSEDPVEAADDEMSCWTD